MDAILKYFRENKGYALMKHMRARRFQTRDIQKLVKAGRIVKVKPGVYRLADLEIGESNDPLKSVLQYLKRSSVLLQHWHFTSLQRLFLQQ